MKEILVHRCLSTPVDFDCLVDTRVVEDIRRHVDESICDGRDVVGVDAVEIVKKNARQDSLLNIRTLEVGCCFQEARDEFPFVVQRVPSVFEVSIRDHGVEETRFIPVNSDHQRDFRMSVLEVLESTPRFLCHESLSAWSLNDGRCSCGKLSERLVFRLIRLQSMDICTLC